MLRRQDTYIFSVGMRRALTFLLIFTYQIMSVVFYLIFPCSTFRRCLHRSLDTLLVDVKKEDDDDEELKVSFSSFALA